MKNYTKFAIGLLMFANSTIVKATDLTILLDLSDRINVPGQVDKDKSVIKAALNAFENEVKGNHYRLSSDKIKIVIAPQSNINYKFNKFCENANIDMESINNSNQIARKVLPIKIKEFSDAVDSIYELAKREQYDGADIWSFFRDNSNLIGDKVIIVTDGYLQMDSKIAKNRTINTFLSNDQLKDLRVGKNTETIKLATINQKYLKLKVLMMEVNPRNPEKNVNEFPILKKYWGDWFDNMGAGYYIYATQASNNSNEAIIGKFVKE